MSSVRDCIIETLIATLSEVFKLNSEAVKELFNSGKLKLTSTPDPSLGDYGVALHLLLKEYDKNLWNEIGLKLCNRVIELAREKCNVEKAEFVDGYLNLTISHDLILRDLIERVLSGDFFKELSSIGGGRKVLVEHTSANPVHPLHIGSGRNSVLGDTFARLLRKLGFIVETRFYVNDLGRQVATLIYGAKIAESSDIKKPDYIKPDHWYGVIYAMTNVLIELDRLRAELRQQAENILKLLEELENTLIVKSGKVEDFIEILTLTREILKKTKFVHDQVSLLKKLYTTCRIHIEKFKDYPELKLLLQSVIGALNEYKKTWGEYRKFLAAERRLSTAYPELYSALRTAIKNHLEAESAIRELMERAESGDPEVLATFKKITQSVLEGFKETLNKLDITFHGFDFESSKEILSLTKTVVSEIIKTKYGKLLKNGAIEVDLNSAASDYDYIRELFYPDQAGRFIIQRSDGTTLYVTRDIAYALYKFKILGASEVYNVIAVEQSREQKQVKATLYILGFKDEARGLHHFAYEMVHLKGMRMSGRRGIYYTLDELVTDMENCILRKLIKERGVFSLNPEVISKLTVANARTLLLTVEPGKVLSLDPSKLCEYEYGTIVEYAYVRAQGILRNALGVEPIEEPQKLEFKIGELIKSLIRDNEKYVFSLEEKLLTELLTDFNRILLESYRELKPNKILEYAVKLALQFNKFYEKHPVIGEKNKVVKAWRTLLVYLTYKFLTELLDILGIPKLQRI